MNRNQNYLVRNLLLSQNKNIIKNQNYFLIFHDKENSKRTNWIWCSYWINTVYYFKKCCYKYLGLAISNFKFLPLKLAQPPKKSPARPALCGVMHWHVIMSVMVEVKNNKNETQKVWCSVIFFIWSISSRNARCYELSRYD